ncbi:Fanconi anemia group J protein homolog [Ciona intestinalis]
MMEEKQHVELMIGGVKVHFPFKPYPSQLSMMSMIVKGLQRSEHCLLESPTGSGKTLSLLCSALAWQQDLEMRLQKKEELYEQSNIDCAEEECCSIEQPPKEKEKVPTIWFGTRTHKQIAQITHELATTQYRHVNMSILSSREHACIHPLNSQSKTKNEGCKELRKGIHPDLPGTHCIFYQNVNRLRSHASLKNCGITEAWDLEDLVKLGTRVKSCPYYAARELQKTASIIFCPYNYLIDPSIRGSMQIDLKNDIVILDEAHNIEDSSREAASFTAVETDLMSTVADLEHLISVESNVEEHQKLHLVLSKMGGWMNKHVKDLKESAYETWSKVWTGEDFIPHLDEWGITADTLNLLVEAFLKAVETKEEEEGGVEEEKKEMIMHSMSKSFLGALFDVLTYILASSKKFAGDYRVTMIRTAQFGIPPPKRTRDGWVTINKRKSKFSLLKLHFWCLNPAVAFTDLADTRCIILTSGTLSPMSSFSSELGLSFPIQLEAAHVISNSQVFVGSLGCGPNGHRLQATYQNTNSLDFQDELGKLVQSVCNVVPYGVLCFFSSYKMLEKLCERWKNTGLWYDICQKKEIVCEPHGRNKADFDGVLQNFYRTVAMVGTSDLTGALFLAVCRGKASEGLDFANNNARAVITVGIPFPNYRDKQVELKKTYNNFHCQDRGLLTGNDWYEIQAFRALNQALGRCIRHRNDWGALIIVDDRFCQNPRKYCKGLSKWVRQKVKSYDKFKVFEESLANFCQRQSKLETEKEDLSLTFNQSAFASTSTQIQSTITEPFNQSQKSKISDHFSIKDKLAKCTLIGKENKPEVPKTEPQFLLDPEIKPIKTENVVKPEYDASETKPNLRKFKFKLEPKNSSNPEIKPIKTENLVKPEYDASETKLTQRKFKFEPKNSLKTEASVKGNKKKQNNDVIVITNTPEKEEILIVPESPEIKSDNEEDDFKEPFSASSKRSRSRSHDLSKNNRGKNTIASQLAKKCKLSLDFTNVENHLKEEVILPVKEKKKRRARRSFINFDDDLPGLNTSKAVLQTVMSCLCSEVIFSAKESDITEVKQDFNLVLLYSSADTLIAVDQTLVPNLSYMSHTLTNSATLNCAWSEVDKHAFRIFQCKACNEVIAVQVVSHATLSNKVLFMPQTVSLTEK